MTVSAQSVKALRDETGAAMMECKRALVEARGDHAVAAQAIRRQGMAVARTRADRPANAGRLFVGADGSRRSVVKLLCETDFVAMNREFVTLGNRIARETLKGTVAYRGGDPFPEPWGEVVTAQIESTVARIREKIVLASVATIDAKAHESFGVYEHADGSAAAVVRIRSDAPATEPNVNGLADLCHDLALHIAATGPRFIAPPDVPEREILGLRETYADEARAMGKPATVVDRIVEGKLSKTMRSICLLEQAFVKDDERTVAEVVAAKAMDLGTTLTVTGFVYDSVRELVGEPGITAG